MTKRIFVTLIAISMVLSMSACSLLDMDTSNSNTTQVETKPNVEEIDGLEREGFSHKDFAKAYDVEYKTAKEDEFMQKYGLSDLYLREVDEHIVDTWQGYLYQFILTDSGFYSYSWDLMCTVKVPLDIKDNNKILFAGFGLVILQNESGKVTAYDLERAGENYEVVSAVELPGAELIPVNSIIREVDGYVSTPCIVNGVGVDGVHLTAIDPFSGEIKLFDKTIPFNKELDFTPKELVLTKNGYGVDGLIVDENGNYHKLEVFMNQDGEVLASLPHPAIDKIDAIFATDAGNNFVSSRADKENYFEWWVFNNIGSYDAYCYPLKNMPFSKDDIKEVFVIHSGLLFVLKDGNSYYVCWQDVCDDYTHKHDDWESYKKEHGTTVNAQRAYLDGQEFKIIRVDAIKQLWGPVFSDGNILSICSMYSKSCFIMDDGKTYVIDLKYWR